MVEHNAAEGGRYEARGLSLGREMLLNWKWTINMPKKGDPSFYSHVASMEASLSCHDSNAFIGQLVICEWNLLVVHASLSRTSVSTRLMPLVLISMLY